MAMMSWGLAVFAGGPEAMEERLVLRDQFDVEREVPLSSGRPVVLVLADREGTNQLEGWLEPLQQHIEGSIDFYHIALLERVPRPFRSVVRSGFREEVDYPVLLDWQGAFLQRYELVSAEVNILVLSGDGQLAQRVHGEAAPERLAACKAAIDAVRADAQEQE